MAHSGVRPICPTCGRAQQPPKSRKATKRVPVVLDPGGLLQPWFERPPNPTYNILRTLVKPTRFDADGRAIGVAYVKRESVYSSTWAEQRYGHSPYDKPKSEIGPVGTLEEVQRAAAGNRNAVNESYSTDEMDEAA